MKRSRPWVVTGSLAFLAAVVFLDGCADSPSPNGLTPKRGNYVASDADEPLASGDVLYMIDYTEIRGSIVDSGATYSVARPDGVITTVPRSHVKRVDLSPATQARLNNPMTPAPAAPRASRPVSSHFLPRSDPRDPISTPYDPIMWNKVKNLRDIVGPELAMSHLDNPDSKFFLPANTTLVFRDMRRGGYRLVLVGQNQVVEAKKKPGVTIDFPDAASIPKGLAFVSSAIEIKSLLNHKRTSWVPPDVFYVETAPMGAVGAILGSEPFTGGKPQKTRMGDCWAFALPRNKHQFIVYLIDPNPRMPLSNALSTTFIGFQDKFLVPDYVIDVLRPNADGSAKSLISRMFVLPYPPGLSPETAPGDSLSAYFGPPTDASRLASFPLPPRQAVQLPQQPPAVKANVLVSYFNVAKTIPQVTITAWGTGRPTIPTKKAKVKTELLKGQDHDEIVRMDVSKHEKDMFPVSAWFYHRRSYVWRQSGGMLTPPEPFPAAEGEIPKKWQSVQNVQTPHALPILFLGETPKQGNASAGPASGLAAGLGNAFLQDALRREGGGSNFNRGGAGGAGGGSDDTMTNTTNIHLTVPDQVPMGMPTQKMQVQSTSNAPPAGRYLSSPNDINMRGHAARARAAGNSPMGQHGYSNTNTGVHRDPQGNVVYDPQDPSTGVPADSLQDNNVFQYTHPQSGVGIIKK